MRWKKEVWRSSFSKRIYFLDASTNAARSFRQIYPKITCSWRFGTINNLTLFLTSLTRMDIRIFLFNPKMPRWLYKISPGCSWKLLQCRPRLPTLASPAEWLCRSGNSELWIMMNDRSQSSLGSPRFVSVVLAADSVLLFPKADSNFITVTMASWKDFGCCVTK